MASLALHKGWGGAGAIQTMWFQISNLQAN